MPNTADMQPARRKRRSMEEIMDRLIQAAGEEFARTGFDGATTAAIARKAEVTEAQLFRYFGSKSDLFREAVFKPLDRHFATFNAQHQREAGDAEAMRENARLYIAELQNFIAAHSDMLLSLVVAQTYAPQATRHVAEIDSLAAYFERGAAVMRARADQAPRVDPKLMVRVSFAAVFASVLFKRWLFPPGLAADEQIGAAIADFVIDGISANLETGHHDESRTRE